MASRVPIAPRAQIAIRPRTIGLIALGLAIGLVVAWLDSRPGWDDTGITVGLLVAGGALLGAIDGRRPWLWAALVGGPLPIVEVPGSGTAAPFVALLFAAIGVSVGILIRRAASAGASTS